MIWKECEFCKDFKSVVYCKADAANLCLCCDAKVHSANALSSRHPRTLLCDSCRQRPCSVRCLDHGMFLCHGCDSSLHAAVSSQHQRRVVSCCYTGCPSAKDFVAMWGFRVNDDNGNDSVISIGGPDTRSSGKKRKGKVQRDAGFLLQQILELEKFQLSEGNGGLLLTDAAGRASASITNVSEDLCRNSSNTPRRSEGCFSSIPQLDEELAEDFSRSPFPQMEPLSSSSTVDNSFWQCKGLSNSYQLWYQNMQDIGVCEETERSDGFDIPDIDLCFRNFEELFGADQEPIDGLAGDNMISVSSLHMESSLCRPDICNGRTPQMKKGPSPFNGSCESTDETDDSLLAAKPSSSSLSLPAPRQDSAVEATEQTATTSSQRKSLAAPLSRITRS